MWIQIERKDSPIKRKDVKYAHRIPENEHELWKQNVGRRARLTT